MTKCNISKEEFDVRYANWLSMIVDLVKPKDLFIVGGRATSKTTEFLAKRSIDVAHEMPRATLGIVSDTYVNALTNIIPMLLLGWERQKVYEDYHYVTDKQPDYNVFKKPYSRPGSFKHSISYHNGCYFMIKSLDRPSSSAGVSIAHLFGDEAKFLKEQKLKKSTPALRGDAILFSHSPYYMGQTFTTDMPNVGDGEDDWILRMSENMDKQRVLKAYQCALVINDIQWELYKAEQVKASERVIENIKANLNRWQARMKKLRTNLTFFHIVSSLVNVDVLTFDYILTQYQSLQWDEFKRAILSIHSALNKGESFYGNLSDIHFYDDGHNYEYYDQFGIRDNITKSSRGLRYIQTKQPLEAGFDAGNMMSLTIGQEQGNIYRVLKFMYTLTPEWIRELANQFIEYFGSHEYKQLNLYFDRAANNYNKAGQDFATQLKKNIEKDITGKPTGWHVKLMSLGQGNIFQEDEFNLMNVLMSGKESKLPTLLIDKYECKELRSSLLLAPVAKNSKGRIIKVKNSEKLPVHRLPMESTNPSDSFKYLMCRKKWMNIVKQKMRSGII